ncbi:hypothetical protein predicted by Glimmer/Critica [Stenotrophomonas maltophilia RA8]|uniref:hypothetical protein n=1 Tax=Stenotrophomonas TaxID=40323 RepID=UPI0002C52389|nr:MULTISPECIES: hypothetical protein [Stenotrophomonas]KDE89441.1 hypothetical protein DF40_015490 [Stenotrophomonas maltophilia M30]MBA0233273.1 hypothetical protein [Stenotrophomonas maltophilia]MBA0267312.1 hypothetical protein [Stenotrophomonas maltophilia]MBA0455258.1 hypothetical protein [Stenotrophomonas maltophilia]MCD5965529.1 hypothetical protein [Stenotrophomonas maltophilia]
MENIFELLNEQGVVQIHDVCQVWTRAAVIQEVILRSKVNEEDFFACGNHGDYSAEYYFTFNWCDATAITRDYVLELVAISEQLMAQEANQSREEVELCAA